MRVLVIEDESGITSFLKQGLEEEGYEVDVAVDGQTGLQQALSTNYDLLLVDWMLPQLTGIELCKAYRKENKETPIIFLTARDTVQDAVFGLQAGANDYIRKPFHFEELLERIKVQLRPITEHKGVFTLGPFSLNTETHQVFKHAEEILLTQKEFQLLEYLIRHKGKVCRRNKIMDTIWGLDATSDSGVIDVFINALRKKLKIQKDEEYIQTIRGVGYIARES
ncbi:MAG: response regulator transcription factor [Cyclobacteriaceae bacterium]|nr:response regulator transcription factor [Cyclobacteriaceae bacterium]UYN86087.1 MAG: response regulator transcription factor [Cyclobacteriaceae bacterium]